VAEAVQYAHEQGVIHRDLNAGNIMGKKGEPRVLDFGIAKVLDPDATQITHRHGGFLGPCRAPELEEYPPRLTPAADIYSLGAVWFKLITGRSHNVSNRREILRELEIPDPFREVIERCMTNIDRRYASMDELAGDISRLENEERPSPSRLSLDDSQVAFLAALAEDGITGALTSVYEINDVVRRMVPSGVARSVAFRALLESGFLRTFEGEQWNGDSIDAVELTERAWTWVRENQEAVETAASKLRAPQRPDFPVAADGDDIPF
ncbi:MAG: protein kinase, partial [Alphaproteobacteria bacterium]|nr:protein kinase [Alphaproteobacteria bacterium]